MARLNKFISGSSSRRKCSTTSSAIDQGVTTWKNSSIRAFQASLFARNRLAKGMSPKGGANGCFDRSEAGRVWLAASSRSSPQRHRCARPRCKQLEHPGTFPSQRILRRRHCVQLVACRGRRGAMTFDSTSTARFWILLINNGLYHAQVTILRLPNGSENPHGDPPYGGV